MHGCRVIMGGTVILDSTSTSQTRAVLSHEPDTSFGLLYPPRRSNARETMLLVWPSRTRSQMLVCIARKM